MTLDGFYKGQFFFILLGIASIPISYFSGDWIVAGFGIPLIAIALSMVVYVHHIGPVDTAEQSKSQSRPWYMPFAPVIGIGLAFVVAMVVGSTGHAGTGIPSPNQQLSPAAQQSARGVLNMLTSPDAILLIVGLCIALAVVLGILVLLFGRPNHVGDK